MLCRDQYAMATPVTCIHGALESFSRDKIPCTGSEQVRNRYSQLPYQESGQDPPLKVESKLQNLISENSDDKTNLPDFALPDSLCSYSPINSEATSYL